MTKIYTSWRKNLEDHNIRLVSGQTVQAVEGDGKVERLVTDKETFDVDMVILAVGFRPNTALADGKIELFRNGAFLLIRNKKHHFQVSTQLVTVTIFDNARNEMSYIVLHLMRFVQVLLVPAMQLVMN